MELLYRMPAILVALAFHEWAHARAAYSLGDPTAFNFGRMTLNPLAHIDPWGFVMLALFRFGWAKPVPINPRNFKNPRRDEIIVGLAGVFTNLLLAFAAMGVFYGIAATVGLRNAALNTVIYYFYFINLSLCVFNLLPIPPLDGYQVFSCLLARRVGLKPFLFLEKYGFMILIVLLMTGVLGNIMSVVVNWLMNGMIGIYNGLFGLLGII
ncbi:MAG: site-2 protease family protein [Clostridia bacterium]|nr:site-2 protease family protein [Clostridia bacterium]MBQ4611323.1 site-2 protease family protein [Clostridia bacterium]